MKTVDSKKKQKKNKKSRSINTGFQANYLPGMNKREKKNAKRKQSEIK